MGLLGKLTAFSPLGAIKGYITSFVGIASLVVLVGLITFAWRADSLRASWRDQTLGLTEAIRDAAGLKRLKPSEASDAVKGLKLRLQDQEATIAGVVTATKQAARLKKLEATQAAGVIVNIGEARDAAEARSQRYEGQLNAYAAEASRYRALSENYRKMASAALARKQDALDRLSNQAITPGDRANCVAQLKDANAVLDFIYKEGY